MTDNNDSLECSTGEYHFYRIKNSCKNKLMRRSMPPALIMALFFDLVLVPFMKLYTGILNKGSRSRI